MSTNPNTANRAYLEIILGPMFSGKTSKLVQVYRQCLLCNIPVLTINHSNDLERTSTAQMLENHDNIKIPCISVELLSSVPQEKIHQSMVILINEGQFFQDLYLFVVKMLEQNKQIYVAGLDGDFQRNMFGSILQLIPLCDKVDKLTSLCGICKDGTRGIFSRRITSETVQTLVGGSANYIPVCRSCYEKHI
jgi:thymidine kinase